MIDNPLPNPHPASPLSGGGVTALKVEILAHYLGVIDMQQFIAFNLWRTAPQIKLNKMKRTAFRIKMNTLSPESE